MAEQTPTKEAPAQQATRPGERSDPQRPLAAAAWYRCAHDYRLDPGMAPETTPLISGKALQERQLHAAEFFRIARSEANGLARRLARSSSAAVITDPHGVILHYVGAPDFNAQAGDAGLRPGCTWSERMQGSNAIGTTLAIQAPAAIHGEEHYLSRHRWLSGAATPLHAPDGTLQLVLALLAPASEVAAHQGPCLGLLETVAQMTENRYFQHCYRDQIVLRFHNRPESIGSCEEGLAAVGQDNRLIALSPSALFLLGEESESSFTQREVTSVLNVRTEELLQGGHGASGKPHAVYDSRTGRRFFLQAVLPWKGGNARRPAGDGSTRATPRGGDASGGGLGGLLEVGDPDVAEHIARAKRLANEDIPILVHGETGTGKEVFAHALHHACGRRNGPFVAVNCASIPETLIESELFGYRPGAFTGASSQGQRGKIVDANGGTLFLDEIGDMPLALQARLLRVLQEREVVPLGGSEPIPVDVCVVSATHRDLSEMIAQGSFRSDLYYRLQGFTVTLPPLRERGDRERLIEHILELATPNEGRAALSGEAREALLRYHWPGNIRELQNCLRTAVALAEGGTIELGDLPAHVRDAPLRGESTAASPEPTASQAQSTVPAFTAPGERATPPDLRRAEREALLAALRRHQWNADAVAAELGISRSTVYRKMKRHDIPPPRQHPPR